MIVNLLKQRSDFRLTPTQVAFFGSLVMSLIAIWSNPVLNRDGILYVETARAFLNDGFSAAYALFNWPFLSILMAIVSKLTGIGLENSGHLLNAFFLAGSAAFLVASVSREHPEVGWLTCLVVLSLPGLNGYRHELIREYGCWFFTMLSFWLAGKWSACPDWQRALFTQFALCVASLFRPEALVFLAALVMWQIVEAPKKEKWHRVLMIGSMSIAALVLIIFLYMIGHLPARLSGDIGRVGIIRFNVKAEAISALLPAYAKEQAKTILLTGSLSIIPLKFVKQLGIFIIPLAFLFLHNTSRTIARYSPLFSLAFAGHLLVLAAFVVDTQFLAGRYVSVLCLLGTPIVGLGLWQFVQSFPRWKTTTILLALVVMAGNVISFSAEKTHMIDAGKWLASTIHSPEFSRIYIDSSRTAYYAGWGYSIVSEKSIRLKNSDVFKSGKFDLVVLEVTPKDVDVEKWLQECDLQVIKRFENGKKDAVVVAEKKHEP